MTVAETGQSSRWFTVYFGPLVQVKLKIITKDTCGQVLLTNWLKTITNRNLI